MPDETRISESRSDRKRVPCPVCNGVLVPLPGNSAVEALERHLERDHWYPCQLAHDAANEFFNNEFH